MDRWDEEGSERSSAVDTLGPRDAKRISFQAACQLSWEAAKEDDPDACLVFSYALGLGGGHLLPPLLQQAHADALAWQYHLPKGHTVTTFHSSGPKRECSAGMRC